MRLLNKGAGDPADAPGLLPTMVTAVAAFHADPNMQIGTGAKLSFVKLNAIDVNGHYSSGVTNIVTYPDLAGGGSVVSKYPNQIALAVSLTTGFSRGPAHRGRFYLPLPCQTIDVNGLITAGSIAPMKPVISTFVAAVNAASANWEVGIMSRKLGAPGARKVTGELVGRVFDTQRRRRRSLVEAYE
jgi:hypothetical protein